ncbi:hypothetical protein BerOc1_02259 [Pseudodesulfovibrio hydrargyri]|uniref:DUF2157 domain-containing protein n=1 Tax=Pseudodesulfovibrio hydrargyri TaxID=2125990 RepID=A0A1J5N680_9BACT|nr:DUF2157 domain-containing protein [Pseudodesulfovibrio hydrargyri]OIQ50328.1 hypothetical protein BerOc1_02259 [Pseudodesulfovibrio hydrargyri]
MKFTNKDLDGAVRAGVIARETRDALVAFFEDGRGGAPAFTMANVLYYLGGLIVIGAMTIFVTDAWERLGGLGHLLIGAGYGLAFLGMGNWLWRKREQRVPGGILVTAAVCMTPLTVYGIQELSGWWVWDAPGMYEDFYRWIKGGWFFMEIGTVAVGGLALRRFRFPFVTLPVAFSLWFLSMDLTAVLYGPDFTWDQRKVVSLCFGLAMLAAGYLVDRRTRQDFAFWLYLFGMIAFWCGLTSLDSDSELGKFVYCCVNLLLMAVSVILQRRVFIVFGALGVSIYLGHLAADVFDDTLSFSFALSGLGLLVILAGLQYHKHREAIEEKALCLLPAAIRRTLPRYR